MHFIRRAVLVGLLVFCLPVLYTWAEDPSSGIGDPVEILSNRLTHGLDNSPLKSALSGPLIRDEVNAALLIAARDGIATSELKQLFPELVSLKERLALLEREALIVRQGDHVQTSFPILLGERREEYRRLTSGTAAAVYEGLMTQFRPLLRNIAKRGWSEWSYHFVMAEVFDSQFTWSEMVERKFAPPLRPPIAWVIYPPHPFKTGTNYYYDPENVGEYVVVINWTPRGSPAPELIGGAWEAIHDAALNSDLANPEVISQLQDLGLIGQDGRVLVPVIRKTDPLYEQLRQIAHAHVELLVSQMPLQKLMLITGLDAKSAWTIAYHDINWDLLQRMVAGGVINVPPALRPLQNNADPKSMIGVCAVVATFEPFIGITQIRESRSRDSTLRK